MLFYFIILIFPLTFCDDTFKENLFITNFNEAISFHFDFQTKTSDLTSNNYHLFPKVMAEIVKQHSVSEMHLSLSKGFWNTDKWGLQPLPLPSESAELWAWFEDFEEKIDVKWDHLSHALSGLFCASLNKLSNKMERISPNWAYSPKGLTNEIRNNSYVRKSVLSGESVCTENLTPWIKLLPCKRLAGLAQLMKPSRLFSSHFTSITVDVQKICMTPQCDSVGRMIHQTITLVLDRKIFGNVQNIWSLQELLNVNPNIEMCSLAKESLIYVYGFGGIKNFNGAQSAISVLSDELLYVDLKKLPRTNNNIVNLDISGLWPAATNYNDMSETFPVMLTKLSVGSGNIKGGIKAIIRSNTDENVRVIYEESLPWYFQFHFHTLTVEVNSVRTKPEKVFYRPSLTRKRMTHLELLLSIPPRSVVVIQYEFKKILQNWNEFPPDANHEFYIGASSLTFRNNKTPVGFNNSLWHVTETSKINEHYFTEDKAVRVYSEVVLVTMPCPDFSMPFNALCLACTVIAIMVGGIHKYTTCSIYVVNLKEAGLKGKLIKVMLFIKSKLSKKEDKNIITEQDNDPPGEK